MAPRLLHQDFIDQGGKIFGLELARWFSSRQGLPAGLYRREPSPCRYSRLAPGGPVE
jgi:hypothetical protein